MGFKKGSLGQPRYKFGKQTEMLNVNDFVEKVESAIDTGIIKDPEQLAYLTLLWHTGVRKSEGYELMTSQAQITPEYLIIDFGQRKKHKVRTLPLKIPRSFYGLDKYLIPWIERRQRARSPELFPMIRSTTAWKIVKRVLGVAYYPHYLRLRKLTASARCAKSYPDMIAYVKAISGLKSLAAINAYLGSEADAQKAAMEGSE